MIVQPMIKTLCWMHRPGGRGDALTEFSSAAPGRARLRLLAFDGFIREPNRQAAALAQAGVTLTPIHEVVLLFGSGNGGADSA